MCVCACGLRVKDNSESSGREVTHGQQVCFSRGVFSGRRFSIFHFSFVSFVWMQCTKCQECRKTYYCVVVQGMRWCFCFVSCHKWSILDVQFPVKTIESCSSGASTSGVDIFGGRQFCICFATFFHSCVLWNKHRESVRAEEGFLASCEFCSCLSRDSFPSNEDVNLYESNSHTLDFSVTVMKCHKTGNTDQNLTSLGCFWRNWRRKPTSFGKESFFFLFILRPSLPAPVII